MCVLSNVLVWPLLNCCPMVPARRGAVLLAPMLSLEKVSRKVRQSWCGVQLLVVRLLKHGHHATGSLRGTARLPSVTPLPALLRPPPGHQPIHPAAVSAAGQADAHGSGGGH